METIETKYLGYCKPCRILPQDQIRTLRRKHQPTYFMKTTNNKVLVITLAISAVALVAGSKMAASFVPAVAIGAAYVAVAMLYALAVVDYRLGPKSYSAR
jgi:hypothetical protein